MTKATTLSDADIRELIVQKFGYDGGCRDLAKALKVSASTASALRRGEGGLAKPAALFGYIPGGDGWVKSTSANVDKAGYVRWTEQTLDYVRDQLFINRSPQAIARDLGVSIRRLRDVIKEHSLADQALRTPEERRYAWAEREARQRGGTLPEMTAYMNHLLSTPEKRTSFLAGLEQARIRSAAEAKPEAA